MQSGSTRPSSRSPLQLASLRPSADGGQKPRAGIAHCAFCSERFEEEADTCGILLIPNADLQLTKHARGRRVVFHLQMPQGQVVLAVTVFPPCVRVRRPLVRENSNGAEEYKPPLMGWRCVTAQSFIVRSDQRVRPRKRGDRC